MDKLPPVLLPLDERERRKEMAEKAEAEAALKKVHIALVHIAGLDDRKQRGRMDERAERALKEAEDVVLSATGDQVLAAWRRWRDSSVRSIDPTRRSQ